MFVVELVSYARFCCQHLAEGGVDVVVVLAAVGLQLGFCVDGLAKSVATTGRLRS